MAQKKKRNVRNVRRTEERKSQRKEERERESVSEKVGERERVMHRERCSYFIENMYLAQIKGVSESDRGER